MAFRNSVLLTYSTTYKNSIIPKQMQVVYASNVCNCTTIF